MPTLNCRGESRRSALALLAAGLAVAAGPAPAAQLSWLGMDRVKGNGVIRKQTRELARFSGIALSVNANVVVRVGAAESVTLETDENLLPLIETVVSGGTLEIRPSRSNLDLQTRTMQIVVQSRQVDQLAVGGGGTITAETLIGPRIQLDVGGSGSIQVKNASADSVAVSIGGSGTARVGGVARKLAVAIGGSGDVQAEGLKAERASVDIAGSGRATVWATGSLAASIAASGDLHYYGDALVNSAIVGSGRVKRLGAAPR